MFVIVDRATRQPLGIVNASSKRELFDNLTMLADEAGVPILSLDVIALEPAPVRT